MPLYKQENGTADACMPKIRLRKLPVWYIIGMDRTINEKTIGTGKYEKPDETKKEKNAESNRKSLPFR
jgi:hypothetical protein